MKDASRHRNLPGLLGADRLQKSRKERRKGHKDEKGTRDQGRRREKTSKKEKGEGNLSRCGLELATGKEEKPTLIHSTRDHPSTPTATAFFWRFVMTF